MVPEKLIKYLMLIERSIGYYYTKWYVWMQPLAQKVTNLLPGAPKGEMMYLFLFFHIFSRHLL